MLEINLLGAFWVTKAAQEALRRSGGAIVNTASDAVYSGRTSSAAYACAKAALVQLTRQMALGLAPDVRVNAIAPGYVNSNWQCSFGDKQAQAEQSLPLARVGEPYEYADFIVFLAVGATYLTGETVISSGGGHL